MNEYCAEVNGATKSKIQIDDNNLLRLDGRKLSFEIIELLNDSIILKLNNKFYDLKIESKNGENITFTYQGNFYEVSIRSELQEKANQLLASEKSRRKLPKKIKSPMPGMIIKFNFNLGDQVNKGDTILVLEAMKMENEIKTPVDCVLKEIFVEVNQPVEKGQILFSIE